MQQGKRQEIWDAAIQDASLFGQKEVIDKKFIDTISRRVSYIEIGKILDQKDDTVETLEKEWPNDINCQKWGVEECAADVSNTLSRFKNAITSWKKVERMMETVCTNKKRKSRAVFAIIAIIGLIGAITVGATVGSSLAQLETEKTDTEELTINMKQTEELTALRIVQSEAITKADFVRNIGRKNAVASLAEDLANNWRDIIDDRTETNNEMIIGRAFGEILNNITERVAEVYKDDIDKQILKIILAQNTQIKTTVKHYSTDKDCYKARIESEIISIVPEIDQRRYREDPKRKNALISSDPTEENKRFWMNPYGINVKTKGITADQRTVIQGRRFETEKNIQIIFFENQNPLIDTFSIVGKGLADNKTVISCDLKNKGMNNTWTNMGLGVIVHLPANCQVISPRMNISAIKIELGESVDTEINMPIVRMDRTNEIEEAESILERGHLLEKDQWNLEIKVKKELETQKAGKAVKGAIQRAETWGESISGFFEKLENSLGTALGIILLIVVFVTIAYIIGKCKQSKTEIIEKQPPYNPNYSEEKAINALDRLSEVLEEKEKAKKKKEKLEIELMNEVD